MGTHVYFKYLPEHDFGGKRVLNIGCGFAKYRAKNVVNLDAFPICKPDVVWDLSMTPLPFENESFDLILANHILEHVPNWWNCVTDCARMLKVNGILEIWVPGAGSDSILGYRDHINTINDCSFFGVSGTYRAGGNAWAEENARGYAKRLKQHNRKTRLISAWWLNHAPDAFKRWASTHLRNVIVEDGFFFRKISQAEFDAEEKRANDRRDASRAVSMLPMRKAGIPA